MRSLQYAALINLDATADHISDPIPTDQVVALSAHSVSTGTATGTVKFQASNDPAGVIPTNWADISQTVSVTAASSLIIPKFDCCYQWLRIVFTKNTGTGNISVNVKTLGY